MEHVEYVKLHPSRLRLEQAKFFKTQFDDEIRENNPASSFKLATYFDSYLTMIIAVKEMLDRAKIKHDLKSESLFQFLQACRNLTIHRSVLLSYKQTTGYNKAFHEYKYMLFMVQNQINLKT